ncbi:hypothetical protein AB0C02_21390 [Micromonospora sp. NPDC048999]|uniref:hypothetical protein n=1 Tax=Micromonospora sp. NPDC048999 TaxID=3155391 RepID=UPI0033CC00FB
MRLLLLVSVLAALGWGGQRVVWAWRSPGGWVRLALVAAACTLLIYGYGLFSAAAYDIGETCVRVGQDYDSAYQDDHWQETSQWFPLHNRCNASYDLVPAYVNPLVVILAVLNLGGAVMAATLMIAGRRRR